MNPLDSHIQQLSGTLDRKVRNCEWSAGLMFQKAVVCGNPVGSLMHMSDIMQVELICKLHVHSAQK